MSLAILVSIASTALATNGNGNAYGATNSASSGSTTSSNGNGAAGSGSSTATGNGNQVQNQVQTQNQGQESQLQVQTSTELQAKINDSKPTYSPRSEQAKSRMSTVATAAENLVRVAERVENRGIGDQIRVIARTQSENCDKINENIDKVQKRSAFSYFFVGANYSAIKNIQGVMDENQLQIKELEKLMADVTNEGDKTELQNEIDVLVEQQTTLRDQLHEMTSGFSLFGWLNRWMRGVSL